MKRSFVLAALLALAVGAASAQTPAAPVPSVPDAPGVTTAPAGASKIAVIAFQVAVGNTNEFQRDFADLQKKYDPKRQQLKAMNDDIEAKTKALETEGSKLSDAERATRAKEIDDKKKQLQRAAEDDQNDFQQEMQQLYSGTAQKVYDVMTAYAIQHGFTLVLDMAATQDSPVLYAVETTNITKQVVDAYNVKSGVPAPPPSAGGQRAPQAPAGGAQPRTVPPAGK